MINSLINFTGHKLYCPFYHIVSDDKIPHVQHLYPIKSVELFKKELAIYEKYFLPISLRDVAKHVNSPVKLPSYFLSFDDGFSNCRTIIAPILKERNIPATFFVNPAFIDNQQLMFRNKVSLLIDRLQPSLAMRKKLLSFSKKDEPKIDKIAKDYRISFQEYLEEHQPYMTSKQLQELVDMGFTIGSHSYHHPLFKDLELEEQIAEVNSSLAALQSFLPVTKSFAFPFSDEGVRSAFFTNTQHAVDLYFTTGGLKHDEQSNVFRRSAVELTTNVERLIYLEYVKNAVKRLFQYKYVHKRNR